MKRTPLAPTLLSALLCSTVFGIMFGGLAMANPSPELDFPSEPVKTPPAIVVHSPIQNQNQNSTNVLLNFTITKPAAWIQPAGFYGPSDEYGNKSYKVLGNITSVYYVVDGGERQNISVHDATSWFDSHPKPLLLNFSLYIALEKGAHDFRVGFEADSYYLNMTDTWNGYISSFKINGLSEPISFTVLQESFPTALIVAASGATVAVIGSCLLVSFRKRKRQAPNTQL